MKPLIQYIVSSVFLMTSAHPLGAMSLDVEMRHTANGNPLLLDSLRYQNVAGETYSFTRVSYLLSGFALEHENGAWEELDGQYAFIDLAKRQTSVHLQHIPEGKYQALRFHVGPDSTANAGDVSKLSADHPLNPNFNGLHWSWQGGYIFMALEGHFRGIHDEIGGYAHHLARDSNRTRISLTAPLDFSRDSGAILLDFDLGTLLNAPRPLSFERDGTATHSRDGDPIAAALVANLPGAFRVAQVLSATPSISKSTQVKPLYLPENFTPYRFTMSRTFPLPDLPRDNPLIEERVALGRALFHENALSRDGTISCASCHQTDSALADPRRFSIGIGGQVGTRNAMPLFNLAWKSKFFWDGRAPSLRAQAVMPIEDHTEMDETPEHLTAKLSTLGSYPPRFDAAFGAPEVTMEKIGLAIEQFLLSLTSYDSKFDRAMSGKAALSDAEKRGFELFMTEYEPRTGNFGADCFHCHGGALFSDHQFHNNGLGGDDSGRAKITHLDADRGKFSTPSLRNVARTAPYMHDGRFATLEEVVEHYSSGVARSPTLDPNLAKHPESGLNLTTEDKAALVAFLRTLTEEKSTTP
ncbi:MAG: cytochrome C peroxidase [Akkermansiaceae bacterium]|nr:cytochrome C peroxidase [Akkermansiaceae bacterium]